MKARNFNLLLMIFASMVFFACEDGQDSDCDSCTTKIIDKKVELKNTDVEHPNSTLLTSVFLYRYGNQYVVDCEVAGCFSTSGTHYYVCNPGKIDYLPKSKNPLRVDIIGNIREKKATEKDIENCDYCHNQQTFDIEILKIKILK